MIGKFVASLAIVVGLLGMPIAAHAAPASAPLTQVAATCKDSALGIAFLKSWDACLDHDSNGVPVIKTLASIWLVLLPLLEDAIKIAGYTAAGFMVWGGVKYIKSQGDPAQINEARQVIYNALFGLVLAMISVAIVNFIAGAFNV
jgi:hypothetical protein